MPLVGDNDDRTPQDGPPPESDISADGQVVELQHGRHRLETFLELSNLLEVVAEFDDWVAEEEGGGGVSA